jgi:hypothetical protein
MLAIGLPTATSASAAPATVTSVPPKYCRAEQALAKITMELFIEASKITMVLFIEAYLTCA